MIESTLSISLFRLTFMHACLLLIPLFPLSLLQKGKVLHYQKLALLFVTRFLFALFRSLSLSWFLFVPSVHDHVCSLLYSPWTVHVALQVITCLLFDVLLTVPSSLSPSFLSFSLPSYSPLLVPPRGGIESFRSAISRQSSLPSFPIFHYFLGLLVLHHAINSLALKRRLFPPFFFLLPSISLRLLIQ